jgi:tetratricopeptide (TPR) repeat protein
LAGVSGLTAVLLGGCRTAPTLKPSASPAPSAAPVAPVAAATGAEELFAQAQASFDQGDYARAKTLFAKVLERAPESANTDYNIGLISEREGNLQEAQAAYRAALEIDAHHRPSLLNLGRVYRELKQYPKAEATLRVVLAEDSNNLAAHRTLMLVFADQGLYGLAELVGANGMKIDDRDPGLHNNQGLVYLKMGDRQLALQEFRKAVSLDDRFAEAYTNLGALALEYRDYANAEKYLSQALALAPRSYLNHLYYAFALDGQKNASAGKDVAAAAEYEKALEIHRDPEAVCGAGWAYSSRKETRSKAIDYLTQCKALAKTGAKDRQKIDAKLVALQAVGKELPRNENEK